MKRKQRADERTEAPKSDEAQDESRVSLHPLDGEEALVALLATPKDSDDDE